MTDSQKRLVLALPLDGAWGAHSPSDTRPTTLTTLQSDGVIELRKPEKGFYFREYNIRLTPKGVECAASLLADGAEPNRLPVPRLAE